MVTALAGLEAGVIGPEDTVRCLGNLEISDRRFHCWKRAGHGNMNLHTSLRESCDVYYYELALKIGIEKITAMAKRLGIGVQHDLPMSSVAKGLAPTKAWKREVRKADWRIGDTRQRVDRARVCTGLAAATGGDDRAHCHRARRSRRA